MSVSVDPRLVARRQEVHESWARRRMRWLLAVALVFVVLAAGVAVVRSPWLAVRSVAVSGSENAATREVLDLHGVVEGAATISIRAGVVAAALEKDPWVLHAEVTVTWPGSVDVVILERRPAAWVEATEGWVLVAEDGVILDVGVPAEGAPVMRTAVGDVAPGDVIEDAEAVGAIRFLGLLPPDLAVDATSRSTPRGIEGEVLGHRILLGNHQDMPAKVATLVALLENGVGDGDTLNIISPVRPGVTRSQVGVEGSEEDVSSSEDSG